MHRVTMTAMKEGFNPAMFVIWMRKVVLGSASMLLALLLFPAITNADRSSANEALIKAGFLLKLPAFVEWPTPKPSNILRVGVLHDREILDDTLEILKNAPETKRTTEVREIIKLDELSTFDVVFFSQNDCNHFQKIKPLLHHAPILTVADCENFSDAGGMFRLFKKGDHIKLEANRRAAHAAGINLSYRLAAVAEVVDKGDEQ